MRLTREVRSFAAPAVALSIAMALVGAPASAQPAPSMRRAAARTMTLTDCVAIAASREPRHAIERLPGARRGSGARAGARRLRAQGARRRERAAVELPVHARCRQLPVGRRAQTRSRGRRGSRSSSRSRTLFAIYDEYKVQDFGVDVAAIRRAATRRDVAFRTVEEYYRLLEAMRLSEVAEASVTQLESAQKASAVPVRQRRHRQERSAPRRAGARERATARDPGARAGRPRPGPARGGHGSTAG